MLPRRLRSWLALATLVALASCDLNPQPILPDERATATPEFGGGKGTGGTGVTTGGSDLPEPTMPGDSGEPGQSSGGEGSSDSGAGGESAGGQGAGGEAGAEPVSAGAGGDAP
jgi:hypothetical protein